jgi:ATPase subunit of ABC transporter with duplicated ATPase domains
MKLAKVKAKRELQRFWLEQLQDTATQEGPFITYCRARHVDSLNALIAQVLGELNQDSEGIATQCLEFQLKPDYTLEPIHGALSIGKCSRGQKTRTYLALFLAMFHQTRSRLPFRTSFVFLDEVMDTLDLHGIEALQRWLQRYVAARGMQAFLLTHRETSLLGRVIEVVRDRKRGTMYRLRQEETAADFLEEVK